MPKLVWRVKLVAELEPGVTTETEVARIERGGEVGLADLGLRLEEVKRLTAALQARMVPAQVARASQRRRGCAACGRVLASKGHYPATFRSLFGEVPVRVGLPRNWGSSGDGGLRVTVVGRLEALPEAAAERAVVDGAADLEQPVGATA